MSDKSFGQKRVGEIRIAGIRFHGREADCPARFAELRSRVEPFIDGPALQLLYGVSPVLGRDMEVAYPVTADAETSGIEVRTLPAVEMVAFEHRGVLSPSDAENSLQSHLAPMISEMISDFLVDGTPRRIVYVDPRDELKKPEELQRVEVQYPLMMRTWLDRLERGITELVDPETAGTILEGREEMTESTSPAERTARIGAFLDRLDERVTDERIRHRILMGCAHRSPAIRAREMRQIYAQTGSVDAVLTHMRLDRSARGDLSWFEHPQRIGDTIYATKIPGDPEAYRNATTPQERKAAYCHCPIVREALTKGKTISPTFCGCGLGWFPSIWNGIFETELRYELIRSILRGDDDCQVAIHLPAGVV